MDIEFDPDKIERNVRERGLPFDRARDFEFETAVYLIDDRKNYGERRIRAFGMLDGRARTGLRRGRERHPNHQLAQGERTGDRAI